MKLAWEGLSLKSHGRRIFVSEVPKAPTPRILQYYSVYYGHWEMDACSCEASKYFCKLRGLLQLQELRDQQRATAAGGFEGDEILTVNGEPAASGFKGLETAKRLWIDAFLGHSADPATLLHAFRCFLLVFRGDFGSLRPFQVAVNRSFSHVFA